MHRQMGTRTNDIRTSDLPAEPSRAGAIAARVGFVARGVVYVMIGVLAIELALGHGGTNASQAGALSTIAHQPFGQALLIAIAIGLAGYAGWRLLQAARGTGFEDGHAHGGDRLIALGSGLVYLALFGLAVRVLTSPSHHASSPKAGKTTADVFNLPAGREIVGVVGVALVIGGLANAWRGLSRSFVKDARTGEMGPTTRRWYTRLGVAGYLGRAAVFVLVGALVTRAAIDYKASQAKGLDGALQTLVNRPYGPPLLIAVAACLIAFGLYSAVDARYRRV
ncbi:MAG: DUF1206 domain-containing protein [Gaiellales bacterium]